MKKCKNEKIWNQAGYTITEAILVMAIFTTLIGITTISLLNIKHKSSLSSAVDVFIADLKEQQLKAMTGDTQGSGGISNYGIDFETTSYTLFRGSYGTSNFVVNLPDTIQASGSQIVFQKGSGEITTAPHVITFRDSMDGNQKVITINKYGVVDGIN